MSSKVHVSGQQTYILERFKNNHLGFSPANPFLATHRMISHSRPPLVIWNDVAQPFII
jgi:hypothetical protein